MAASVAPRIAHLPWQEQAPLYLTIAAAVTAVVSIAASQILMGMALVAFLVSGRTVSGRKLRCPAVAAPLAAWIVLTLISLAASGHVRAGLPQVKKLYVFLMLFLAASAFRSMREIRALVLGWAVAAVASSAWGFEQFARKYRAAEVSHRDFYLTYIGSRITGFMDHWMTFSGEMMMALLLVGSLVLFSRKQRGTGWLIASVALIAAGLLAAETRSAWMGALAGGLYLLWFKRNWLAVALPLAVVVVLLISPFGVRERALSIFQPHTAVESGAFRALTRRVGWEMVKAHPLLGVGPEQVAPLFRSYVPADVPRPLPPDGYYGHLDNIYFQYAAERGVPALLALLWFLGRAVFDFAHGLRRLPADAEQRWMLHAALAVILAIMLSGYYELNLGDSEVLAMFLAVVGAGYAALNFRPNQAEKDSMPS
jgi:putative inorganic carbon (hco3(-)) transporter